MLADINSSGSFDLSTLSVALREIRNLTTSSGASPAQTMRVAGRRKVGERDAVVVVDRPSENVQRRYFFDAETEEVAVVYRRTDGNYGLIQPVVDRSNGGSR